MKEERDNKHRAVNIPRSPESEYALEGRCQPVKCPWTQNHQGTQTCRPLDSDLGAASKVGFRPKWG